MRSRYAFDGDDIYMPSQIAVQYSGDGAQAGGPSAASACAKREGDRTRRGNHLEHGVFEKGMSVMCRGGVLVLSLAQKVLDGEPRGWAGDFDEGNDLPGAVQEGALMR